MNPIYTYVYIYTYEKAYLSIDLSIYLSIYIYIYRYEYAYIIYLYMYICIYIYICTYEWSKVSCRFSFNQDIAWNPTQVRIVQRCWRRTIADGRAWCALTVFLFMVKLLGFVQKRMATTAILIGNMMINDKLFGDSMFSENSSINLNGWFSTTRVHYLKVLVQKVCEKEMGMGQWEWVNGYSSIPVTVSVWTLGLPR
jgi:hypothetical protein